VQSEVGLGDSVGLGWPAPGSRGLLARPSGGGGASWGEEGGGAGSVATFSLVGQWWFKVLPLFPRTAGIDRALLTAVLSQRPRRGGKQLVRLDFFGAHFKKVAHKNNISSSGLYSALTGNLTLHQYTGTILHYQA